MPVDCVGSVGRKITPKVARVNTALEMSYRVEYRNLPCTSSCKPLILSYTHALIMRLQVIRTTHAKSHTGRYSFVLSTCNRVKPNFRHPSCPYRDASLLWIISDVRYCTSICKPCDERMRYACQHNYFNWQNVAIDCLP